MTRSIWVRAAVAALLCTGAHAESMTPEATSLAEIVLDIKAQPVRTALQAFGEQTGLQVLFRSEGVALDGVTSLGVSGKLSAREALDRLLQRTGLQYEFINQRTVRISAIASTSSSLNHAGPASYNLTQAGPGSPATGAAASSPDSVDVSQASPGISLRGVPEVMVFGKKSLNTDIERTEDDPQPYVVFDRESIERSGAGNLNDFFRTRLPMNTAERAPGQTGWNDGNSSGVNLRGLGSNQTLILIDGRRAAKTSNGFNSGQSDINGIPLRAIERIEVLPTTASAVYGGAATGGVINIIMRRDYAGTEAAVTYDNSFDTDSAIKRVDLSTGFTLFEGKTSVLLTGSYTESNALYNKDRDFVTRGRARIMDNNPAFLSGLVMSDRTNIRSSNGSNLTLDDGTALGAAYTWVPANYGGIASDNGAALVANAGTYSLGLGDNGAFGQGRNIALAGGGPPTKYISGSIRHEFNDRVKGFLEASHTENDTSTYYRGAGLPSLVLASDPSNPFQQDLIVSWSTRQIDGVNRSTSGYGRYGAGLIFDLPGGWVSSADYTLSNSEFGYSSTFPFFGWDAFVAALASGAIDILRDFDSQGIDPTQFLETFGYAQLPIKVTTRNPALRVSGPVGTLSGGRPQISLLLERQDSTFDASAQIANGVGWMLAFPERTQKIDSAYLELTVPLLSDLNARPWARELDLQLAGRWDRYRSVNASYTECSPTPCTPPPFTFIRNSVEEFSPLVALRFKPFKSLALRASYGTGFLPPDIDQLTAPVAGQPAIIFNTLDPQRGYLAPTQPYVTTSGGNPELQPEKSTTWSAGAILTPTWLEGLRVSLDYTKIEKRDNIVSLSAQQILDNEASFPGRVTRGERLPTDPTGWAGPITGIDTTLLNAATMKLQTYDLQLDYTLATRRRGTFWLFAMATWQTQLDAKVAESMPVTNYLGWSSLGNTPIDLRGNVGVEWTGGPWTLGWTSRYFSAYYAADPTQASSAARFLTQGNGGRIPDQMYHDVSTRYQFASRAGGDGGLVGDLLDGLEIRAGVRNVFNKKPPFDVSPTSWFYYSGFGDPRLATYYLTIRKSFD